MMLIGLHVVGFCAACASWGHRSGYGEQSQQSEGESDDADQGDSGYAASTGEATYPSCDLQGAKPTSNVRSADIWQIDRTALTVFIWLGAKHMTRTSHPHQELKHHSYDRYN